MSKKLLFVVTEDWYFCSHRLNLAKQAVIAGFDVSVATRVTNHGEEITDSGIKLIPLNRLQRSGQSPLNEIKSIIELTQVYKKVRPDIVHHVALKPMLYGAIAARLSGVKRQVQAISGFGFVFLSTTTKARILRIPIKLLLRCALVGNGTEVIVQNPDDEAMAKSMGVDDRHLHLVPGSGVDIAEYSQQEEPSEKEIVVTLVARMLWDKGIAEFVEAIRVLKAKGFSLKALLVGDPDASNPSSISEQQLMSWQDEGLLRWLGRRKDIARLWSETNIAVLPSYREGLPKSLLEAASCGRAMVATDVPGCRSVVVHGETGLLVPAKNAEALAQAIAELIDDKELRHKMGTKARRLVEEEFSEDVIYRQIIGIYHDMMSVE